MDKVASKWAFSGMALVFALLLIGFYYSGAPAPTAAALIGACGGGPPVSGDWIIGGTCTCENETRTMNGNLQITTVNGVLNMKNCTLIMNVSYNGQYGILVSSLATLNMSDVDGDPATLNDRSSFTTINDSARYNFTARLGSHVYINDSVIRNAGFDSNSMCLNASNMSIRRSVFEQGYGLYIYNGNNSLVDNNTFNGTVVGVRSYLSRLQTITNNNFINTQGYGVTVSDYDSDIVSYNSFYNASGSNGNALQFEGLWCCGPLIWQSYSIQNVTIRGNTITNGYGGIVTSGITSAKEANISDNVIANNTGDGISLTTLGGRVWVTNNTVINNSYGIFVQNHNMSAISYNYVAFNRKDGIKSYAPTPGGASFDITFNTVVNNSGWAVNSTLATGAASGAYPWIQNNTMCYNGNTTYWEGCNGFPCNAGQIIPYYSGETNGDFNYIPMYNTFCVNFTRPIKGGCTNNDAVQFYVDGNPWSWAQGHGLYYNGYTNCSLYVDFIFKNFTLSRGANSSEVLTFNGTSLAQGPHTLRLNCDPPVTHKAPNTADTSENYTHDTQGPGYNSNGSSGPCDNVTLSVYWSDGTCNVSYSILSTNETTSYLNYTDGTYGSPQVIEWNQSWSTFNWWNETMKNNYINWLVWANDSAGNWNSTTDATFLAQQCAVSTVTGGGGGGGGGGAAQPPDCTAVGGNMTIAPAEEGQTVSCYPATDFRLFNFTFAEASGSAKLTVAETGQPTDVPAPAETVYKFYRFTAVNLTAEKLSGVLAEFVVPNNWINGSGVPASDVGLYRWTGTEWEPQPTEIKLNSTNNTYFYADVLSLETDLFAIAAGKACPVCPSYGDWGECIQGRQEKLESICSEETSFVCENQTLARRCVCGLCPDVIETDCIDGRKNVTTYSCSKETEYECVPTTAEVDCAPKLPQLLLPLWENFASAPPGTQIAMVSVGLVVLGCAAAAGYWWFALRLRPERMERIKELIRKYMPKKRPPEAPAEQPQPEGGEEDGEYGT